MRKALLLFVVMISAVLFSTTTFASAWRVPVNLRIVQQGNIDNPGRIYATIQEALASITDASASKPYLIKVMPGVYTAGGTLRPFISIEGSGRDATILVDGPGTPSDGVFTASGNSEISNLSIVSAMPYVIKVGAGWEPTIIRNVNITATNPSYVLWHENSYVILDHVNINAAIENGSATMSGGFHTPAKLAVKNSTITAGFTGSYNGVVGGVWGSMEGVQVDIDSSEIVINAGDRYGFGASRVSSVTNSRITVTGTNAQSPGLSYVMSGTETKIYNTYVDAPVFFDNPSFGGTLRCANVYGAALEPLCPLP